MIDAKTNSILRFAANGRYIGPFGSGPATRLAVNAVDDVAILDRNGKAVSVVDREGRPLARLQAKGTGYDFQEPVDVAFDALGHFYVLDRASGSIFVFGPQAAAADDVDDSAEQSWSLHESSRLRRRSRPDG